LAIEGVAYLLAPWGERDRVDGKIATSEVVLEGRAELDFGVAAVGADVTPKRRDLVHGAQAVEYADSPELDPDRNRPPRAEQLLHLLRCCRRR
jgi:hypothetical protein